MVGTWQRFKYPGPDWCLADSRQALLEFSVIVLTGNMLPLAYTAAFPTQPISVGQVFLPAWLMEGSSKFDSKQELVWELQIWLSTAHRRRVFSGHYPLSLSVRVGNAAPLITITLQFSPRVHLETSELASKCTAAKFWKPLVCLVRTITWFCLYTTQVCSLETNKRIQVKQYSEQHLRLVYLMYEERSISWLYWEFAAMSF